jgi:predicted dehydrogenase
VNLTPEQQLVGRRAFLRALAGTPAVAALGGAIALRGPVKGGPVRLAFVGLGVQGRQLLGQVDPAFGEVRALCDINPAQLRRADEVLAAQGRPPARHYSEWTELLGQEDVEAVVVAVPLWLHADVTVGCLEAGRHVLCEKMMAWDLDGCDRMSRAAQKAGRLLEIGYQRSYNPVYLSAYEGIVRAGLLGDVYHARLSWHRNGNWRRPLEQQPPDYDPARWGYPSLDHLVNWRLYWRYSKGLFGELASHQVNVANWFFDARPEAVQATGGIYRWKDGREVYDHVYALFDYPQGRTAVFSSIESNAYERYSETFMGTKGTLILSGETEAYLFEEGASDKPTGIEVSRKGGALVEASDSRPAGASAARSGEGPARLADRPEASRREISAFCAAVRTGTPLACGPERARHSAHACLRANEAVAAKARLTL